MLLKCTWLTEGAFGGASLARDVIGDLNPDWKALVVHVPRLMATDFSDLRLPRLGHADQTEIDKKRVWLMAACAVHYNLNMGLVVRYLGGEYTASWRDVGSILQAVEGLVSRSDADHIKRILERGSPETFNWEEPKANQKAFIRRCNNPSIKQHEAVVAKTMNKEESRSHVVPFPRFILEASPFARHTPQTIIPGKVDLVNPENSKKPRLC